MVLRHFRTYATDHRPEKLPKQPNKSWPSIHHWFVRLTNWSHQLRSSLEVSLHQVTKKWVTRCSCRYLWWNRHDRLLLYLAWWWKFGGDLADCSLQWWLWVSLIVCTGWLPCSFWNQQILGFNPKLSTWLKWWELGWSIDSQGQKVNCSPLYRHHMYQRINQSNPMVTKQTIVIVKYSHRWMRSALSCLKRKVFDPNHCRGRHELCFRR